MKFDPTTRTLYTDAGALVKVLFCPLQKQWEELEATTGQTHRRCDVCSRRVLDTGIMTDDEVLATVRKDPTTCLLVSASQPNLTLI